VVVEIQYCAGNQLIDWDFLEHIDLENVQQELWRSGEVQSLARDDDDEIDADGDPDLRLDGVEGVAEEMLDRQVLLDPLEKGFDLPALAINLGDGERRQIEAIGQEDEELVGFGIAEGYAAQAVGVGEFRFRCGEQDALIAAQTRRFVDLARGDPGVAQIVLGTDDEGDLALMQRLQPGEIEVAAVDDGDRARRPVDQVEHIDVVHLAGRDMDENGNGATQIDNGVGLDGRLGRAEVRPREQRQTQIDGRRIQRVEWFLQTQTDVLVLMQFDRDGNQAMAERLEQSPVAPLVGIGQGGAGYPAANSDVVELGSLRVQASHQIAQALAPGELGIGDADEMVPGREVPDPAVRRKAIDQMLEVAERHKSQQLRENRLAAIHGVASFAGKTGNDTGQKPLAISNRRNRASRQNPRHYWVAAK
jgi:hypothetical protein